MCFSNQFRVFPIFFLILLKTFNKYCHAEIRTAFSTIFILASKMYKVDFEINQI